MLKEIREFWVPWMLFSSTMLAAVILLLLVAMMPYVPVPTGYAWLSLFADDTTVRRTAIACAVGLIVTAFTFFRPRRAVHDALTASNDALSGPRSENKP